MGDDWTPNAKVPIKSIPAYHFVDACSREQALPLHDALLHVARAASEGEAEQIHTNTFISYKLAAHGAASL